MNAPLRGLRVVEFEALGPGPLVGRLLADMGAEVTLIRRPQSSAVANQFDGGDRDLLRHGKTNIGLNLKQQSDVATALDYVAASDALIEGNRPGVMERLGLGPAQCAARNPKLVYGRMTGWGQSGPLAQAAGHDLNYVALSGLLSLSAHRGERPTIPPPRCWGTRRALSGWHSAWSVGCSMSAARGVAAWSTPPSSMSWEC